MLILILKRQSPKIFHLPKIQKPISNNKNAENFSTKALAMKVMLFTIWWSAEVIEIWAIEYFGDWSHFGDWRNWPKVTLITEIFKTGDKRRRRKKSQMNKRPPAPSTWNCTSIQVKPGYTTKDHFWRFQISFYNTVWKNKKISLTHIIFQNSC